VSVLRTAIIYKPRDIRVEEVEDPTIGDEDALIRVEFCGICGSDVHRYLGTKYGQRFRYPLNSGHEYSGTVMRVGYKVKQFKVGDKVTLGVEWTGGDLGAFSEYLRIRQADARLRRLPEEVSYEEAALIEPLIIGLNGFARVKPREGDRVLILGCGTIGLCLVQCCKSIGSTVIASERSSKRLDVAKRLGAIGVSAPSENLEEHVKALTDDEGVEVAFECAGTLSTSMQALTLTRRGGKVCLVAHYSNSVKVDLEEVVSRAFSVYGVTPDYSLAFFEEAVGLILSGKVKLRPLISHIFPIEKAREAFETASRPDASIKVLIKP
jgi:L-iditol 2-dehydrogenase